MEIKKCCDNPKIKNSTGCPSCWTCENCNGFGCSNLAAFFSSPQEVKIYFTENTLENCKPIIPENNN